MTPLLDFSGLPAIVGGKVMRRPEIRAEHVNRFRQPNADCVEAFKIEYALKRAATQNLHRLQDENNLQDPPYGNAPDPIYA